MPSPSTDYSTTSNMTHLVDEPTTKRCLAAINAKHDAAEES